MDRESLGNQIADLHSRIERADRVLEDDLHVAAHLLQVLALQRHHVDAVEAHSARRRLEQAEQRNVVLLQRIDELSVQLGRDSAQLGLVTRAVESEVMAVRPSKSRPAQGIVKVR